MAATAGVMASPMVMAASLMLFRAIPSLAPVVSRRLAYSRDSAEFADHACSPSRSDWVSRSPAPAIFSIDDATRTSAIPRSSRVEKTSPPDSLIRPRPWTNKSIACAGRVSNACANWSALTPATWAKASSSSPPALTALDMSMRTLLIAVPPASASTPTDDSALDRARRSDSVIPTTLAAPAIRDAMLKMSRSVEAPLFPSSTRAAANRLTPSVPSRSIVPMTLEICAIDVAASSAVRFVVSPSWIMVSVKPTTSPLATPS